MKKCPRCNEKTMTQVEQMYICSTCQFIQGNKPKLENLKALDRIKSKNKAKNEINANLEEIQKRRTDEPYLRFRLFKIEVENGRGRQGSNENS